MSSLVQSLRRRALLGVAGADVRPDGLRSWFSSGSFYVDSQSTPENVIIKNILLYEYSSYMAFDFQRFALGSLESIVGTEAASRSVPGYAWKTLKLYYSAFFAAHALIRALGDAVIRLDRTHAQRISEVAQIFLGNQFIISSGTFRVKFRQGAGNTFDVELVRCPDGGGGAHEQFWREFLTFWNSLMQDISASGDQDATNIIVTMMQMSDIMKNKGKTAGAWLSSIRNDINYQHKYGVWFPDALEKNTELMLREIKRGRSDRINLALNSAGGDLAPFVNGNLYLAALCYELTDELTEATSKAKNRFLGAWRRFHRLID